jgi:hypothetical protein
MADPRGPRQDFTDSTDTAPKFSVSLNARRSLVLAKASIRWSCIRPPIRSIRTSRESSCRVSVREPATKEFGRLISATRKLLFRLFAKDLFTLLAESWGRAKIFGPVGDPAWEVGFLDSTIDRLSGAPSLATLLSSR